MSPTRPGRENETPARAIKARCSRNGRGQVYRWQTVIRIIIGECAKNFPWRRKSRKLSSGESSRGEEAENVFSEKKTIPRLSVCSPVMRAGNYCRDRFNWYGSASNGLTTIRWNRLCLVRGHAARLVPPSSYTLRASRMRMAHTPAICAARKWDHII